MNTSPITIIRKSNSWNEFNQRISKLTNKQKGDCFEALTKYYLQLHPTYSSKLRHVWNLSEVPTDLKKHLNLPDNDEGIDLVAETREGCYWAIQCKYRSDELKSLTRPHVDTFISMALKVCKNFELALVCTTLDRFSHKLSKFYGNEISLCCGDVWRSLNETFFHRLHSYIDGKIVLPGKHEPRPHQQTAITKAHQHFISNREVRGKLIMPCASGKSLTSYWMARSLGAKRILLAVPSLALIRQSLEVWTNEALAEGQEVNWICVCSDTSVKDVVSDELISFTQDLGIMVHTDPDKIAEWLSKTSDITTLVITTYQSGKAISEGARKANFSFDFGIMDEAHKTVGKKDSLFSHLLFDENIPIKYRLFMTATERRYKGNSEQILSMEDPEIYGDTFHILSFKEALECQPPILSDYRIVTIVVTRSDIAQLINNNIYVRSRKINKGKPEEAETLAAAVALRKAIRDYPIRHSVSFHSNIKRAMEFRDINDSFNKGFPEFDHLKTFHVSGKTPTALRSKELDTFSASKRALMTNARCLTEGIDVPGIDCVVFADPKKSAIDIVQATGRALRPSPEKEFGYVIVPILIGDDANLDGIQDSSSFRYLLTVLRALSANDERIVEYFRSVSKGRFRKLGYDAFTTDIPDGLNIDVTQFADSIELKLWFGLKRYSWRPFSEAREFAISLGLENSDEWRRFMRAELPEKGAPPKDIPIHPHQVYEKSGWISWGDWLGTENVWTKYRKYRSFEEARRFANSMHFKTQYEWYKCIKDQPEEQPMIPKDIPTNPDAYYKEAGWNGWGDFLGSGNKAPKDRKFRVFEDARKFAHGLDLKNYSEWCLFRKGQLLEKGLLPNDIPSNPNKTYAETGWISWPDWLGIKRIANQSRNFMSFEDARNFAVSLHLSTRKDWEKYRKGELHDKPPLPSNIPQAPDSSYRNKGWRGWPYWLGTKKVANQFKIFLSYEDAREFVRKLDLYNEKKDWRNYLKGKLPDKPLLPENIPRNPAGHYKNKGWKGWGDWLGTGEIWEGYRTKRDFVSARRFVHSLGLNSQKEWRLFCKGSFPDKGSLPTDIPAYPNESYKDKGWISWGDWLGAKRSE